ncbi:hypothetical protein [Panacagrimonas sp.]|uniref:hypothetical protein n=1 Tax=Panacagrimonas sp. TaxID=2480088 RepID=UPI003B52807C
MKLARLFVCMVLPASLLACNPAKDESGDRATRAGDGRAETQGLRNTENIGYSGNAIGDRVDAALDANDRRTEDLDRQLEEATGN